MFNAMAGHLDPRARVLAVDLPGLGGSREVLPEVATLDESARLVLAAINGRVRGPLIVAGLSMGGYVAQAIAARAPGQLAGLILLDTRMTADQPGAAKNRLEVASRARAEGSSEVVAPMAQATLAPDTRANRPDVVEFMESLIADQTGAGVAWSQVAMSVRPDRADVIAHLDCELLVIVGEADEISPVDVMTELARTAQRAVVEVVPDAGHMTPVEQPAAVAKLINAFLTRVSP